ncbi:MAG: NAD(P)/FAD-dependent oxidoreductase [Eubacterium sp.]
MKENDYKSAKKVDIYDVAIIGAGPAGLSAALTLNVHNKSIVWFGTNALSDKVEKSEKIANYAGFELISGKELNDRFRNQIKSSGLELTDKMVTQISKLGNDFMVLANNDIYKAKAVLLTIGAVSGKGIKNELELLGHGVSYCATCDGFLYKGKSIAVFCGNERYEHEVKYLAEIADKVYLFANYDDVDVKAENVEILDKPMKAVVGENKVLGIELTDGRIINVDGAFFLRSAVAPATILNGLETDDAHIAVNRNCETNIAGCFAAGDCTGRPYQIAKAVGEGNVAAHSITKYLAE